MKISQPSTVAIPQWPVLLTATWECEETKRRPHMEVTQLFLPSYGVHTSVTHIREGYCQKPDDQLMSEMSIYARIIIFGVNLYLTSGHIKEIWWYIFTFKHMSRNIFPLGRPGVILNINIQEVLFFKPFKMISLWKHLMSEMCLFNLFYIDRTVLYKCITPINHNIGKFETLF